MCKQIICFYKHPILWFKVRWHIRKMKKIWGKEYGRFPR